MRIDCNSLDGSYGGLARGDFFAGADLFSDGFL